MDELRAARAGEGRRREAPWPEPVRASGSTCSGAVLITGSCFLFFWGFISFFSVFGAQEGSEDGLCMVPCVCCVPGGVNTWACSWLLELCCVLLGAGMS